MRSFRRLTAADARAVPWKNGRGITRELALWPPGADFARGDFDWRLSRAAVDEPGPFSAFPGFERVLVVTSGAGLRLHHGSAAPRARVAPLQPHAFSGDWPTTAALVDGPVADFNVLARRGAVSAEVTVLRPGPRSLHVRELLQPGHTFVHVLSGTAQVRASGDVPPEWGRDAGPLLLAESESLWIRGEPAVAPGASPHASAAPTAAAAPCVDVAPVQLELGGSDAGIVLLLVQLVDAGDGGAFPSR